MKLSFEKYCQKNIACSCGHDHFCPIAGIVVEEGALLQLPVLLKDYHHIVLAADENTWAACGQEAARLLGSRIENTLIYRREDHLVPDEKAVAELEAALSPDTDFVVGVGSGVINDLCKYVTWKRGMDYAIVGTAPSMDGYASSGAAMIVDGMKVTYTARPPRLIIADVNVLKNAPLDMIRSGYGDIIGKYSSLNDWKLSHLINGEHFCEEIFALVKETTDAVRAQARQIISRDGEAIAFLTEALILIGVTLSLLGSTRPGSGSEHHLSHFFEIVGLVRGERHFPHGTDVAYATVVTARMRQQIRALKAPVFHPDCREKRLKEYRRIFGPLAGEVQKLQDEAQSYEKDRSTAYLAHWDEILRLLAECPSAEAFTQMLEDAGYDMDAFEALYGAQKIADAMRFGKDLKDRYSVLWLHSALFGGQEEA